MNLLSVVGRGLILAALMLLPASPLTAADNATPPPDAKPKTPLPTMPPGGWTVQKDWRWVKGAVFVPTNCVNEAQEWDEYDPAINDRELHYASFYGFNLVRVFFHYDTYLKNKQKLLANIEDFLTRANKYGLKSEFVFFDDCHFEPDPQDQVLQSTYQYPTPIFGVHNSRWWLCPGKVIKSRIQDEAPKLQAYVQDIVSAHKDDPRIAYWEIYNEPHGSGGTMFLLQNGQQWIHDTGTKTPMTSTGTQFRGGPYSDFETWHWYGRGKIPDLGPDALNTECMQRDRQSVPMVVNAMKDKSGYVMWELGIGRDNCRFAWGTSPQKPAAAEPTKPFHGIVYPDGHPWSEDDVKAIMGDAAFAAAPVYQVSYFKDDKFSVLAKESITPMIDFDLLDERGYGSPDASAGVPEENFSTIWKGTLQPTATGTYTFYADSDGQVQVSVNGQALLAKTTPGRSEISHTIDLVGGKPCPVEIRYAHATGTASLHFDWSGPNLTKTVVLPVHGP
jgi:PA14 domain